MVLSLYEQWLINQAKATKTIRKYIQDTHTEYLPNDPIWKEIYNESKLAEDPAPRRKPRIGKEYQAVIPELNTIPQPHTKQETQDVSNDITESTEPP